MAEQNRAFAPDLYYIEMPSGAILEMDQNEFENFLTFKTNISDIIMQAPEDLIGRLDPKDLDALLKYTDESQVREPSKPVLANTPTGQQRVDILRSDQPQSENDLAFFIRREAERVGVDPEDLATVISFETSGTFNPKIVGGEGNKHIGLIQMGPTERKQFGYDPNGTLDSQMKAVGDFLITRGFKPGMGILDLYSTINAGSPGKYEASDEAAGGTKGTVRDKVMGQMDDHRKKAAKLLSAPTPQVSKGIDYQNTAAIRRGKLTPSLEEKATTAVSSVFGPGYSVRVHSGGQVSNKPGEGTGSIRHNEGMAGDMYIVDPQGNIVNDREQLNNLKKFWLDNQYGSVGSFMKDQQGNLSMHLDEWTQDKLQPGMGLQWDYGN